mgnify:FL=1
MSQERYTYKQILLGIRNEHLQLNKQLEELKAYIKVFDKHVIDYFFQVWNSSTDKNPELLIHMIRNNRKVRTFIKRLFKYCDYSNAALMVRDNNGCYYPLNEHSMGLRVSPDAKDEFSKLANEILDLDIGHEMNDFNLITAFDKGTFKKLIVMLYQLKINLDSDDKSLAMRYYGRDDVLRFSSRIDTPTYLTQDTLDYLLNADFPSESFSEYHQRIIENAPSDVDIVVPEELSKMSGGYLKINEDGNKLVLTKTKNPRR